MGVDLGLKHFNDQLIDQSTLTNNFFRELDDDEVIEFKQWARDNYTPGDKIKYVWHPVIRRECLKMYAEKLGIPLPRFNN